MNFNFADFQGIISHFSNFSKYCLDGANNHSNLYKFFYFSAGSMIYDIDKAKKDA